MRRAGCLMLLGVGGAALGQQPGLPPGAQKMDPGVSDRGLGIGRVDLRQDLRQQNDFGSVYRFTMPNPFGGPGQSGRRMFMRIEGGMTAVFPESVYAPTRQGEVALVPPGTTYYIGGLPRSWTERPEASPARAPNYLDLRADALVRSTTDPVTGAVIPPARAEVGAPVSLWNDEGYRARVVGSLIDRAAAARP